MKAVLGIPLLALLLAAPAAAEAPKKWGRLCASCHGADGAGKTKMGEKLKVGDMTAPAWQKERTDDGMKKAVRDGLPDKKKPAIAVAKLTDPELDEMIKFVRTLKVGK